MNKSSNTKKIYILSSVTAVVTISIITFVIIPLNNKIISFKNEIYDKRVQLVIYEQQRTNVEQTSRDYNMIKNNIENISKMFISKDEVLNLITPMEEIAEKNEVMQNINLNSDSKPSADNILSMSVTANGDWESILNYLSDLEKLDYYILIEKINFTPSGNKINLSFNANTYSL